VPFYKEKWNIFCVSNPPFSFISLKYTKTFIRLKNMRIDKFLNSVNITKRRTVAQDMITNGVVSINGKVVKASKNVELGNIIELAYLKGIKKYEVLLIPTMKSTPKSDQEKYIREIS